MIMTCAMSLKFIIAFAAALSFMDSSYTQHVETRFNEQLKKPSQKISQDHEISCSRS